MLTWADHLPVLASNGRQESNRVEAEKKAETYPYAIVQHDTRLSPVRVHHNEAMDFDFIRVPYAGKTYWGFKTAFDRDRFMLAYPGGEMFPGIVDYPGTWTP